MLYDPKWDEIYTVEGLVKWLEQQPAQRRYSYVDPAKCAVAQYLKSKGVDNCMLDPDELRAYGWQDIVFGWPGRETFGTAAARGRNLLTYGTTDPSLFRRAWHAIRNFRV